MTINASGKKSFVHNTLIFPDLLLNEILNISNEKLKFALREGGGFFFRGGADQGGGIGGVGQKLENECKKHNIKNGAPVD